MMLKYAIVHKIFMIIPGDPVRQSRPIVDQLLVLKCVKAKFLYPGQSEP